MRGAQKHSVFTRFPPLENKPKKNIMSITWVFGWARRPTKPYEKRWLDDAPDPRASAASADPPPPPDMGFDDAHFGGGSRATRVGVGGRREKPHQNTVFTAISAFCSVFLLPWGCGPGLLMLMMLPWFWAWYPPPPQTLKNVFSPWCVPDVKS